MSPPARNPLSPRPSRPEGTAPSDRPDDVPVDGVVLAAGRSSRMGRSKASLELEGRSFLERCVDLLRQGGCRSIVVVRSDAPAGEGAAAGTAGATNRAGLRDVVSVRNPEPDSEQISSIRIGLAALPADSAAAAILPVDSPSVRPATVRALLVAFRTAVPQPLIVRPVHRDRPGHPTLFARALFAELATGDLAHGAETVVQRHAAERLDVPVDDAGIVANVNTPDDYRALQEHP